MSNFHFRKRLERILLSISGTNQIKGKPRSTSIAPTATPTPSPEPTAEPTLEPTATPTP